jgi:hypothetical protein
MRKPLSKHRMVFPIRNLKSTIDWSCLARGNKLIVAIAKMLINCCPFIDFLPLSKGEVPKAEGDVPLRLRCEGATLRERKSSATCAPLRRRGCGPGSPPYQVIKLFEFLMVRRKPGPRGNCEAVPPPYFYKISQTIISAFS